jgi:hypothetical protein
VNCSVENPCLDCDNAKLIRRLTERMGQIAAERDILLTAARKTMLDAQTFVSIFGSGPTFPELTAAIAQVSK